MIIDENRQKESEEQYTTITNKMSIAPIIIDYRQRKRDFKLKSHRKIILSSSLIRNGKSIPSGLDIEVNTKLVDKLFQYKEMMKKKKN